MTMLGILPILIIIIIVVTFGSLVKKTSAPKKKYMSGRTTKLLIGGYITVILIAVVVYHLLPMKDAGARGLYNMQSFHKDIYETALQGNVDQIDDKYINTKKEFIVQGEQIKITPTDPYFDIVFFVERKDTNDGKMEVISISTPLYIEGMDYSDKIKPLGIDLNGNMLSLVYPEPVEIKLAVSEPEFTISQFTGGLKRQPTDEPIFRNTGIIYLKIPKDLKIANEEELFIDYVGD